jgi:NAD+ synthase (glutamine-hydrolysing)
MKNNLRIISAQINTTVGDINGNTKKIIACCLHARDKQKADIIVFPENALTGYPAEDLLLRNELYQRIKIALKQIQNKVKNIHIILGLPTIKNKQRFNSAILIFNKKIVASYDKQYLPNQGVFNEKRYFTPGKKTGVIKIKNIKIALMICEDLWEKKPILDAKKAHAQLAITINASPFDINKAHLREKLLKNRAREGKMPIVYVNSVCGQDELVFDGGSMVVNAQGKVTNRAAFFAEELMPIDFKISPKLNPIENHLAPIGSTEERVYQALVFGVRNYIEKNNFKGAIISVSGGIDSALTLAIAVDAIGKDRVETLYLPSRYSSSLSEQIVKEEAKNLGVKLSTISIEPIYKIYLNSLPKEWKNLSANSVAENLQARCRANLLMAFSNRKELIVLSTGNKSEIAVGYATLYGDMVGGFCVLKDIPKTLVYRLAHYRNKISHIIPEAAITRAPSAELAKNQKDSDDLPPYPILDKILKNYVELGKSINEIVATGFNRATVTKVVKMINRNEYKRRQAPPGVKITSCSFGSERRYPITSKFE